MGQSKGADHLTSQRFCVGGSLVLNPAVYVLVLFQKRSRLALLCLFLFYVPNAIGSEQKNTEGVSPESAQQSETIKRPSIVKIATIGSLPPSIRRRL